MQLSILELSSLLNSFLSKKAKIKLMLATLIQIVASLLDFLGILLFGILGLLIVSPYALNSDSTVMARLFQATFLPELSLRRQAVVVGISVIVLFTFRSGITLFVTKRTNRFLVSYSSNFAAKMMTDLFQLNLDLLRKFKSQEISVYLLSGVNSLFVRFLGSGFVLIGDVFLILVIFLGLSALNSLTAFLAIILFGVMAKIVYRLSHGNVSDSSETDLRESIRANSRVIEMFRGYKELKVFGSYGKYVDEVRMSKLNSTKAVVNLNLLPVINKALFEIFTFICMFSFGAIVFAVFSQEEAVGQLSVFLAATSRLAPAFLRLQQSFLTLKASSVGASAAVDLYRQIKIAQDEFKMTGEVEDLNKNSKFSDVVIEFDGVSLISDGEHVLRDIDLLVRKGERIAIIGESGAGKSTILDLMMGLRSPTSGTVLLSNRRPIEILNQQSVKIGFVPQAVTIMASSLRENVVLGRKNISDDQVIAALMAANLHQILDECSWNLDLKVGEQGRIISGGEAQRVGVARALVGNPEFLFLDEATSSLDVENKKMVIDSISALPRSVTIVAITHSLDLWPTFDKNILIKDKTVI